ncbi:single-stranded-DNA-specific exonuclease RecJ [Gemella sp. GH3]|uniref:single-stranded-DNA-specific exonuclease RecJ n=1 Tax=unclassified Gemella TaxID=2624949 RepID=UPI0015D002F7|nr:MULTISPECIES: single-stranded-DNA-specific exonuclease RecJ [unclassified Gemella]MBF0714244.1 single-stranded-DNA-specific exonuclease RecJ [Gemella sp. GH3.1]NYS51196.1 single-stranded-DNA-specific exonuclease RecJ [Gemella sp. GH3]
MGLKYNWVFPNYNDVEVENIKKAYNLPINVAKILKNRNITNHEQIKETLVGDFEEGFDPYLIYNMDKAVNRINKAIENEEKILVYGDYDADGITSTVLLLETLSSLGANVSSYIPNRFTEGYGPNKEAFSNIINSGISLIITVDNGIAAVDEVDYANSCGCDVIITDHHKIQDNIPNAYAIIHPEHPEGNYPFGKLAGVGVTFKLAHALLDIYPDFFLDLVAIGTVADLVPITSENRIFVKQGLKILNEDTRIGLKLLLDIAGHQGNIDEQTIGFTIAPRLNAIGRMASAKEGLLFLSTENINEAQILAQKIDDYNSERKIITENIIKNVEKLIEDKSNNSLLVLTGEFHEGVLGIVASNIVEKYKKPTLVMNIEDGKLKGSARSMLNFNIYEAINKINNLFTAFGGHSMAAGFSTTLENLDEIEKSLNNLYEEYLKNETSLKSEKVIDLIVDQEEISYQLLNDIDLLKPFGIEFEKPTLLIPNITILEKIEFGSEKQYLKLVVGSDIDKLECISFKDNNIYSELNSGDTVDVLCYLDKNYFNGRTKLQAHLIDIDKKQYLFHDMRKNNIDINKLNSEDLKLSQNFSDHKNNYYKFNELNLLERKYDVINILEIPNSEKQLRNIINLNPKRINIFCKDTNMLSQKYQINKEKLIKLFNLLLKTETLPLNTNTKIKQVLSLINTNIDSLKLMISILNELNLVTINKNIVTINKNFETIDLNKSTTYRAMNEKFYIEELLLNKDIKTINDILTKE